MLDVSLVVSLFLINKKDNILHCLKEKKPNKTKLV